MLGNNTSTAGKVNAGGFNWPLSTNTNGNLYPMSWHWDSFNDRSRTKTFSGSMVFQDSDCQSFTVLGGLTVMAAKGNLADFDPISSKVKGKSGLELYCKRLAVKRVHWEAYCTAHSITVAARWGQAWPVPHSPTSNCFIIYAHRNSYGPSCEHWPPAGRMYLKPKLTTEKVSSGTHRHITYICRTKI